MKKKLIELRKFLEQKEEGAYVPYKMNDACKYVSDEAIDAEGSEKEKAKWRKFREKNRSESEFIRLLFMDILILGMK